MSERILVGKIGTGVVEKHTDGAVRTETLNRVPSREPISLPIATRIYPEKRKVDKAPRTQKRWRRPKAMLVFDNESRVDATQRKTFGSYRFIVEGRCLEEGLIAADDLPAEDWRILEQYVGMHKADVVEEGVQQLRLLTRREWANKLYDLAYKGRCLLVAFNFPFDISRDAYDFTKARGRFAGGFSLGIWSYVDKNGHERANGFRPRIGIKHIDSKRALKGFTARNSPDKVDLIPEGSPDGKPQDGYKFRGHFLDLRTLAFALTDRGYTLEAACKDFGVKHGKYKVKHHGVITEEYIEYNRRDVLATYELAIKLLEEYEKHPITLQPTKAYSPAAVGKSYLRAMGIPPVLERQPNFPLDCVGYAATAFFGGRTSAHIRKVASPVVYVDFLSMYPTVNRLMGLWWFVVAREIKVVDHCKEEIESFLRRLTADQLFKPETWKHLTAFVQLIPDGDVLPSRAGYSVESNDWQVAVNYFHPHDENPKNALWFSLPDVVLSVLRTGRIPKIVDAFRVEPHGTLPDLKPIKLRGMVEIDPRTQDFFQVAIEQRKLLKTRTDLTEIEKERLDKTLKVLANGTSYGIYGEMIRQESENKVYVRCHGIDAERFTCHVAHPDEPGEYCFPPFASLITGAARLMLGLLEHSVSELGGTYAMEDTDSMAIVATEHGGIIPCPGGPYRTEDAQEAVRALSWEQARRISQRFADLNPYNRKAVPGSILKIEDDNFDPVTGERRQLWCVAISAKRYNLFLKDEKGEPVLLRGSCPYCGHKNKPGATNCAECHRPVQVNNKEDRWSEHGLGHLLNPADPENEDREWISQAWLNIDRKVLGLSTEEPAFTNLPAVGRITISSPAVMRPFEKLNEGKRYADQIKPFNFLLTCYVKPFGHPLGSDPEHFHLIAPYESNPKQWLKMEWINQYGKDGDRYGIATTGNHGDRHTARVKTYGEIVGEYEIHPESKCADANGNPCSKQTVGLLQRRHIRVKQIKYIGKESNSLEDVRLGMIHSAKNVYTEYVDPRRDEWQTKILPALRKAPLPLLMEKSELSHTMLTDARAGRKRPHPKNQALLDSILKELRFV
jgi:hypothetical protein